MGAHVSAFAMRSSILWHGYYRWLHMLVGGAMDNTSNSGPEDSRFDSQLAIGPLAQFVSNVTCRAHETVSILGPVKCTGRASSVKPKGNQYPYHLKPEREKRK